MGWFDEQIRQRIKNDDDSFSRAFADMSGVVMGKAVTAAFDDSRRRAKDAIDEILKFYHVAPQELPDNLVNINEQLEYLLRPSGIMRRNITLDEKWYKNGMGALLGTKLDGTVIALIPKGLSGYVFLDPETGEYVKVNAKVAQQLSSEAVCFYKPLPLKELTVKDLLKYIMSVLSLADYLIVSLSALAVTLIGLVSAYVNKIIFSNVVTSGQMSLLLPVTVLLVGVTISTSLIYITRNLALSRIETKLNISVQSAAMMRVLSLPAEFFKKYSAGELSSRVQSMSSLCDMLTNIVLTTGLSTIFSVIYIGQMFHYAPQLVLPAVCVILVTLLFSLIISVIQTGIKNKEMQSSAKESGLVFSLLSGIQKIKLSGSEKRMFSKWASFYKKTADYKYNPPKIIKLSNVISTAITLIGTVVIYYFAVVSKVSVAEYMAFEVSYGMVSGAFLAISVLAVDIASIKPTLSMIEPIIQTIPEIANSKKVVTRISGGIELDNISFRYNENMPLVIDNLSLKIRAGQYVAIVGTTGCGKSTLMRLMLGFEHPQKGAVYYDGKDLESLDLKSLRRKIGTVMQNGKLFSGDIYSNIVISAPWLTLEDAWEAARMCGIDEDIRHMPMQMHTIISEGSGGISGGQRQRLMIARAIAPKPKILMFDEATSALDNITQKIVSDSLEKLKCTRIVIAHRLSTIKQCDRIIVLDKGKIAEDGKYEDLIAKDGVFAELVRRQRIDLEDEE